MRFIINLSAILILAAISQDGFAQSRPATRPATPLADGSARIEFFIASDKKDGTNGASRRRLLTIDWK